ncbi:MRN complex-interacting protein isoform X1 [Vespa crabro]|uniref:MRN complex-interacting protein isoform X1 n=1 Tax=Vespa crabro TaxID=7445 RepID=UPI001F018AC0|nr:MRN complex-interacting protein isoform X1 [Vespa crabro]XP_046837763.1 MRN complex-interacting protein isoform X1 [Vespa crabro]
MSQEMNILCCYSCQMFQVHIVKKAKKWQCKVCNEKQSIRRVYFQGSGKDCRLHVQELNSQKLKGLESTQTTHFNTDNRNYVSYDKDESLNQQVSDNWSNHSEIPFDDSDHVSDKEYGHEEQTKDNNYDNCRDQFIDNRIYYKSEGHANNEIEDSKSINSESIRNINSKTEIKSITNNTKENQNIFETYEDFDDALDF